MQWPVLYWKMGQQHVQCLITPRRLQQAQHRAGSDCLNRQRGRCLVCREALQHAEPLRTLMLLCQGQMVGACIVRAQELAGWHHNESVSGLSSKLATAGQPSQTCDTRRASQQPETPSSLLVRVPKGAPLSPDQLVQVYNVLGLCPAGQGCRAPTLRLATAASTALLWAGTNCSTSGPHSRSSSKYSDRQPAQS